MGKPPNVFGEQLSGYVELDHDGVFGSFQGEGVVLLVSLPWLRVMPLKKCDVSRIHPAASHDRRSKQGCTALLEFRYGSAVPVRSILSFHRQIENANRRLPHRSCLVAQ